MSGAKEQERHVDCVVACFEYMSRWWIKTNREAAYAAVLSRQSRDHQGVISQTKDKEIPTGLGKN